MAALTLDNSASSAMYLLVPENRSNDAMTLSPSCPYPFEQGQSNRYNQAGAGHRADVPHDWGLKGHPCGTELMRSH